MSPWSCCKSSKRTRISHGLALVTAALSASAAMAHAPSPVEPDTIEQVLVRGAYFGKRVAAGATAKAIVELPLRVDGEGRCALFMKRATG